MKLARILLISFIIILVSSNSLDYSSGLLLIKTCDSFKENFDYFGRVSCKNGTLETAVSNKSPFSGHIQSKNKRFGYGEYIAFLKVPQGCGGIMSGSYFIFADIEKNKSGKKYEIDFEFISRNEGLVLQTNLWLGEKEFTHRERIHTFRELGIKEGMWIEVVIIYKKHEVSWKIDGKIIRKIKGDFPKMQFAIMGNSWQGPKEKNSENEGLVNWLNGTSPKNPNFQLETIRFKRIEYNPAE